MALNSQRVALNVQPAERPPASDLYAGSPGAGRFLFATGAEWGICLLWGALIAGATSPYYAHLSLWIGVVVAMMVTMAGHMLFTFKRLPSWPHLILLFSGVQMILMAWWAYFHPYSAEKEIGERTGIYLSYAAPAWIAYAVGWSLALVNLPLRSGSRDWRFAKSDPNVRRFFDGCIVFGLACAPIAGSGAHASLGFVFVLLSSVRFVGGGGWLILRAKGWHWRLTILIGSEIIFATRIGMFGDLALWSLALFPLFLYGSAMRRSTVLWLLLVSFVSLSAMESAKIRFRAQSWSDAEESDRVLGLDVNAGGVAGPLVWLAYLADGGWRTVTFQLHEEEVAHLLERQNHGWIINRVMLRVPQDEPYARGDTIWVALQAALLPRVLAPNKYRAGGEYFERFTGWSLTNPRTGERGASMNLGFAGEFYANFGHAGGIAASGILGLLSGLVLRWFYRKSLQWPFWLALFPFVFLWGMKAEEGIGEMLNWVIKASIVAAVVVWFSPIRQMSGAGQPTGKTRSGRTPRKLGPEVDAGRVGEA